MLTLALAVSVTVVLTLAMIVAYRRRARQRMLLWLLAAAVERGRPLVPEVEVLADAFAGRDREALRELARLLDAGLPLPEALNRAPDLVSEAALLAAHVGQESGALAPALRGAVRQDAARFRREEFHAPLPLGTTLLYVWVVLTTATAVVLYQMYYTIPKFKKIYEDFDTELPPVTIALIEISDWAVNYFYLFALVLAALVALIVRWGVGFWKGHRRLPFRRLRSWRPRGETPTILRGLAAAVAARVPIERGLEAIRARHADVTVRARVGRVLREQQGGGDCWEALRTVGYLRRREAGFLRAAERAGNLAWAMEQVAESIDTRRHHRRLAAIEVALPLMVILVGLVVLFICVGFFMPLVQLIEGQA